MKKTVLLSFLAVILCLVSFTLNFSRADESTIQDKKELVKKLVDDAVVLIESKGPEGVEILQQQLGEFDQGESYVFVTSESGEDLVNPAFKDIEGMPIEAYSDPILKDSQMTIVNAVGEEDTAWVDYLWPKPGESNPSIKTSYLKKMIVNGKIRIVGSGYYLDE